MIGLASLVVGVLFAAGIYLMLSRNVQRVAIGFLLISNGVNLLVLTASGLPPRAAPPLLGEGGAPSPEMSDPLPQAFILTAIVIGLGMSALLTATAVCVHRELGRDDLGEDRDA